MVRFRIWVGVLALAACGRTELWVRPQVERDAGGGGVGADGPGAGGSAEASGGGPSNPMGVCGDGVLDPGEACDDGNLVDADGCEADCTLPACGNGIVDPGELCFRPPIELVERSVVVYFGPRAVDCDADGDLDLVQVIGAGLFEPTVISVLINDGQGKFGDASVESPLSPSHEFYASFELGEFDGIANTDMAFAGRTQSSPHTLRILSGGSDCRFTPFRMVELAESHVFPVTLRADDDDLDDLLLLRPASQSLGLGASGNSFKTVGLPPHPQRVAPVSSGDLDEDGNAELIYGDPGSGSVAIRRGLPSPPWFGPPIAWTVGARPFATKVADLDLDGHLDVVSYDETTRQLHRWSGDGKGSLGPVVSTTSGQPQGSRAVDLALGDLDGDGDPDAVVTADLVGDTWVRLLINEEGSLSASAAPPLVAGALPGETTPTTLLVRDLNGDGALDILIATYEAVNDFKGDATLHIFFTNP